MTEIPVPRDKVEEVRANGGVARLVTEDGERMDTVDVTRLRMTIPQVWGVAVLAVGVAVSHVRLEMVVRSNSADRYPASVAEAMWAEAQRLNQAMGWVAPSDGWLEERLRKWRERR